jgi:riboflavin synthase
VAEPVFTGLVEATGVLRAREHRGPGARLRVASDLGPLARGESIAVHGVCLTVDLVAADGFACDASAETLARSTLGRLEVGARVHLERAVPLGGRMGGHIVTGHVDGRVRLIERRRVGEAEALVFGMDPSVSDFIAPKGSVAVDGVSLTVNGVTGDRFDVVVIPHTLAATVLGDLVVSGEANLEVDLLARYVARLLGAHRVAPDDKDAALASKLESLGYR